MMTRILATQGTRPNDITEIKQALAGLWGSSGDSLYLGDVVITITQGGTSLTCPNGRGLAVITYVSGASEIRAIEGQIETTSAIDVALIISKR